MSEGLTSKPSHKVRHPVVFQNLNTLEYEQALDLQLQTLNDKIKTPTLPDRLFFVEHPRVFTLGRRGGRENIIVSENFLQTQGIGIVQTNRGGNITFHGPGQAVLYPVIDLARAKIGVADFVYGLEETMKRTALDFGIKAVRDPKNHGLWVGQKKIGSCGISVKRGISIHGLALNICLDLTPFSWINPCGLENVAMTSIAMETGTKIPYDDGTDHTTLMEKVCEFLIFNFSKIFNISIIRE